MIDERAGGLPTGIPVGYDPARVRSECLGSRGDIVPDPEAPVIVMGKVKQITATLGPDQGGAGALLAALAEGRVRIRALLMEGGKARFVADDPERALAALREAGIEGWLGEALAIDAPADPAGIAGLVERLARAGVKVEAAYTGPAGTPTGGMVILSVSDLETALEIAAEA